MGENHIRIVVRGVVLVDGHLLVAHAKGATNTFLPGGHVEFGESLPAALTRELAEEVGLRVHISSYLGAVEHQWQENEQPKHQLNHIFAASLPEVKSLPLLKSREAHLEFFWVLPVELPQYKLLPSPMIGLAQQFVRNQHKMFWDSTFASSSFPIGCIPPLQPSP